jgi:hypothetical protein
MGRTPPLQRTARRFRARANLELFLITGLLYWRPRSTRPGPLATRKTMGERRRIVDDAMKKCDQVILESFYRTAEIVVRSRISSMKKASPKRDLRRPPVCSIFEWLFSITPSSLTLWSKRAILFGHRWISGCMLFLRFQIVSSYFTGAMLDCRF